MPMYALSHLTYSVTLADGSCLINAAGGYPRILETVQEHLWAVRRAWPPALHGLDTVQPVLTRWPGS